MEPGSPGSCVLALLVGSVQCGTRAMEGNRVTEGSQGGLLRAGAIEVPSDARRWPLSPSDGHQVNGMAQRSSGRGDT